MKVFLKGIIGVVFLFIVIIILSVILLVDKPSPNKANINVTRKEVLNRAQSMIEVKWSPKYDLVDKYGNYTFKKDTTFYGVPYSMDKEQVTSASEFLKKITTGDKLYGNDCSGFVSAAWGISRQTTLSLFNAATKGDKIDGKEVCKISWEALEPGDALLRDNGKGEGHVMLFVYSDINDRDKIYVYEQNVATDDDEKNNPVDTIPVARKNERSKAYLKKEGYFPIRLMTLKP